MNLYEMMFITSLFACVLITLYKLWNALHAFDLYGWRESCLLFVAYMISWGISFITFLTKAEITALRSVFFFANTLFMLNVAFWIIETLVNIISSLEAQQRSRYSGKLAQFSDIPGV